MNIISNQDKVENISRILILITVAIRTFLFFWFEEIFTKTNQTSLNYFSRLRIKNLIMLANLIAAID